MSQATPSSPGLDERLRRRLLALATRLRGRDLHRRSALAWFLVSMLGCGWIVLSWRIAPLKTASFPLLGAASLVVGWIVARWWSRTPHDFAAAAALVERDHPDLAQALRTALEQHPAADGSYHFLQRRVIERAVQHADTHSWDDSRRHVSIWPGLAHVGALGLLAVVLGFSIHPPKAVLAAIAPPDLHTGEITVTPGNAEVERGSTIVVAARFTGDLPRAATLIWTTAKNGTVRTPMARSLSDPIYALTLPRVENDVDYHVEYDGDGSSVFRLQVFDRPALTRADADLDYPDYTGLADRRIEDTRRLSAVEGTKVDYQFMFNKPVRRATLRAEDGTEIELSASNPERTRYAYDFTLAQSARYTLHLQDDAARENSAPPDIRIEALENRRPDLKITFPHGDQRVSALEEVPLSGEAHDDFGLLDYGVAVAIGAQPARYISLRSDGEVKSVSARFNHQLTLEREGVKPDDLVTWFAWADDAGADGKPRRTESDPFFGEVRPFDEIFREQSGGESPGGQPAGGPQQELLELQRQIAIGTWKLRQQNAADPKFADDLETLVTSQAQAQTMLSEAAEQIRDPHALAAAADAGKFMEQAHDQLKQASPEDPKPLAPAWTAAQGAYQALLRLQPRETNVSQSRNGSGAGRNQREINQLRMRNNQDNYESESQAQSLTSPEEREKLETLGRLKDLARRQQDLNQRLQEMQTALQAAANDEERDRIRRELKRLEEEQRRMLSDLDEVRQRMDRQPPSNSAQDSRQQLDQTRESMRQASDSLQQGEVSQALAQGTRAQDNLEKVSDDLRKQSSSRFAEQLREARRAARDLADAQQETEQKLDDFDANGPRALDSSAERGAIAEHIDGQQAAHEKLLDQLRQITEDSEVSEPGLHRQLYDLLRQHDQKGTDDRMQTGSELMRRGLVDQARDLQPGITRDLDELKRGVERAAESVLGDETSTLRFAQSELDELSRQLGRERGPGGSEGEGETEKTGQPGPGSAQAGKEPPQDGAQAGERGPARGAGESPQPGMPGPGQGPGVRTDDPGTGQSGIARGDQPGVGQSPNPGGQPGVGQSPGTGEEPGPGTRPDDAGTGQSGLARGDQPGRQPGAGERGAQQNGQAGDSGTGAGLGEAAGQPGSATPAAGQDEGQQPGGQGQRTNSGPGERSQVAQGNSPGQGKSPGQSGSDGEGSPPGQTPSEGGQPGGDRSMASASGQPGAGSAGSADATERTGNAAGGPGADDDLTRALAAYGGADGRGGGIAGGGPITGEDFTSWDERMRTVETLLDSPEVRARLAAARERAEQMRRDFRRHSKPPQWGEIETGVSAPLSEVRTWLRQELAHREDPTALQPVDRDPVPERFEENVKKYYEALGQ